MEKNSPSTAASINGIFVIGLVFYSFFWLGLLFPDYWWTTHFVAFLSPQWRYAWLLTAGLLILFPLFRSSSVRSLNLGQFIPRRFEFILIVLTTAFMGFLFTQFPIAGDHYGDAYLLEKNLHKTVPTIPAGANEALFSFGIAPWDGQNTILAIITYIAYWGRTTYETAFFFLDTVCGGLFVFCWLVFLKYYLENRGWQWILGLAGLTAPFLLNFYGHIEINAPVYLFNLLWLMTALMYFRSHNARWLWALIPLLVVCIKLHAVAVLFMPACLLTFIYHYYRNRKLFERLFTWKVIGLFLLVPIYAVGAFAYFFVFEDYNDPRHLQFTAMEYDRLFLPLVSPEPPLEKYNLLSFNHIFDYFSLMLLWSPVALFLIIVSVVYYRKMLKWNTPPVIISGISLLLFASLFFVTNPLLTMQMDWDLFCFPAPVFLLFSVVIIEQLQHSNLSRNVAAGCLALALLSIPAFVVHASKPMISDRLESLGIRIFKTYYEWTTQTITYALSLENNRAVYLSRKQNIVEQLEPYAIPGNDYEYARLLIASGNDEMRIKKIIRPL